MGGRTLRVGGYTGPVGMCLQIEPVQDVKTEAQNWRSRSQVHGHRMWGAWLARCGICGSSDGGGVVHWQATFKDSKKALGSRELGLSSVQSWLSPTGRINQWLFGGESQRSLSAWLSLQSKHWQFASPTWVLTNSNRLGQSFD